MDGLEGHVNEQRHEWISTDCEGVEAELVAADARVAALEAAAKKADALADWVGWWLSARREQERSKFTEMRARLDAYRAARTTSIEEPAK